MTINLAQVSLSRSKMKYAEEDQIVARYLMRAARYMRCSPQTFDSQAKLLQAQTSEHARTPSHVILLDPRGNLLSSEAFAAHLGRQRDAGTQHIVLAVGPVDGWTDDARARADLLLSLGPMTLPHELARVVLAEQLYRALTILAGHPYHTGH